MDYKKSLNNGWKFKLFNSNSVDIPDGVSLIDKWFPAKVPGTIHTDLLSNGIIDDPFYSENELLYDWINHCDWEYNLEFDIDENLFDKIKFEGIDTIGEIYLNDFLLGKNNNMFLEYVYDVKDKLQIGSNNLRIILSSAVKVGKSLEEKIGKLQVALSSERVYLRKAQYSFGWDWGPSFPTVGLYKNIWLISEKKNSIDNVYVYTDKIEPEYAELELTYNIKGNHEDISKVKIELNSGESITIFEYSDNISSINTHKLKIDNPKLWYPNGMGKPNLYSFKLTILDSENNELDIYEKLIGIRTIKLILTENEKNTFKFNINGKNVFIKGTNWIPSDSFLPRITNEKYSELLHLAQSAHINMIRVWGGGIYENEYFYETCDKLGLLVWQDFMFACAAYPDDEIFIENISNEVEFQIKRLRNHPSLSIWCGNNENEWLWRMNESESVEKMPGLKIFRDVIPQIKHELDPSRHYWQSSPFGFDDDPNSFNSGNTHQWNIWSNWKDYTEVIEDKSLFVTEFGFQGPANIETFNDVIEIKDRKVQSKVFEHHNKQIEGPERIFKFMANHLPVETKWEDFIYLTQLNQGFALKTCIEHWRTNDVTNGSIIWQLNDCWPVTSWSIIDSALLPKLSYYFVKNIFSPQFISFLKKSNEIEIYLTNDSYQIFEGSFVITIIDSNTGHVEKEITDQIFLEINDNSIISSVPISNHSKNKNIIFVKIYNKDGKEINSNYFNGQPWKYYKFNRAEIEMELVDNQQLRLSCSKTAYFVDLYAKGVQFSKRGFTLLPNEEVIIDLSHNFSETLDLSEIKTFSLNNYLA